MELIHSAASQHQCLALSDSGERLVMILIDNSAMNQDHKHSHFLCLVKTSYCGFFVSPFMECSKSSLVKNRQP
jgi:hypothetical protein